MAHAVITLAVDVDHGHDADRLRSLLVDCARESGYPGLNVRESHVAVDQSLAGEDVDE